MVLSPDGITIEENPTYYKTLEESKESFHRWKQRFESQGYYSSNSERIPLNKLEEHCTFLTLND